MNLIKYKRLVADPDGRFLAGIENQEQLDC